MGLELLGEIVQMEEDNALGRRMNCVAGIAMDLPLAAVGQQKLGGLAVKLGDLQVTLLADHARPLQALEVDEGLGVAGEDQAAVLA